MRAVAAALVLALAAPLAQSATGLAIVCPVASEEGKPIPTSCNAGTGQSGQLYKTPLPDDLVRVDPTRTVGQGADWSNITSYLWKRFKNLAAGELYETCKTNLPDPSLFSDAAQCTAWEFIKKVGVSSGANVADLTWSATVQNTDGSAAKVPVTYKVYRGKKGAAKTVVHTTTTLSAKFFGQPVGEQCYAVTANTTDGESTPSGEGCKVMRLPAPTGGRVETPTNGRVE